MTQLSKIIALVNLLEDPDENIFNQVKNELMDIGSKAIPLLEASCEKDNMGELFQKRAFKLINKLYFNDIFYSLKDWSLNPINLIDGVLIVDSFTNTSTNKEELFELLNKMASDIDSNLKDDMTDLEQVITINDVLYNNYKFKGDKTDYHNPDNSSFIKMIENKKGNPLLLAILYLEIVNRLNLPITGVNLPNHFVLGYLDENCSESVISAHNFCILFYINPFSRGHILQHNEIDEFLLELKLDQKPKYYSPCDNIAIIKRLITNLIYSYSKLENKEKVKDFKKLISLF
jgi:regulator of sirC expression with transglutaminase-like and TPR domain